MQILIITNHLKLEVTFWASQKCLIKYGRKDCYTKLNLFVYQETFKIYFIVSLFNDRHQRLVITCHLSDRAPILAGVPQDSILGSLLFLICISDLPDKTHLLNYCWWYFFIFQSIWSKSFCKSINWWPKWNFWMGL